MEDIFALIKNSFDKLWNFKLRGSTLEVITPFTTTNNKFVSVFISKQNDCYIVSDAGWPNSGEYENESIDVIDNEGFNKLLDHYIKHYSIKFILNNLGQKVHYKKTSDIRLISSLVLDISNFISAVVSAAEIAFDDEKEKTTRKIFSRRANDFVKEVALHTNKTELTFYSDLKHALPVKFSAVLRRNNFIYAINYVTGSNALYFTNSIGKSLMNFEILEKSPYNIYIKNKISLIDTLSPGYDASKVIPYLELLSSKQNVTQIFWDQKERLISAVA